MYRSTLKHYEVPFIEALTLSVCTLPKTLTATKLLRSNELMHHN